MSLQLANRSVKFPLGILEDVPLCVGKFFIPCDFVVMEMEEDAHVPIILGRPFLATTGAIIDVKNDKINFEVGDEKMEYSLLNAMGTPSMGETIYDALKTVLVGSANEKDWEIREYTRQLEEGKANPTAALVKEVLSASSVGESTTPPEEKFHFMVQQELILGQVVSHKGIEVDKAKIEVIERLPPPNSVKGVRSFLGHAGFYRRFIKDILEIARPLTELLAKDTPFLFTDACLEAFNRLKEALISALVLQPLDWTLPLEIMCDASDYAVGGVLGKRKD
ncbi:uncharacterized protein LOC110690156 [Chenopodium quinoa]|uniref:uncharacterized protein LOC110690156 n=1 Tax=Chenopodium quinoa TaxID=63459 RepID=UPI000B773353|nr:uncharacterized protein LOC110690156 [Chenopodium quinoa]